MTTAEQGRGRLLWVHGLVLLGGVAALSWENVWQLRTSLAVGVSAVGTALTLAATMGGMTLGALAAGAWLRGREEAVRPLRLYGALELLIGAAGLAVPAGFAGLEALDARVYASFPAAASLLHAFGVAFVLVPATFAMGASVPVFQLLARRYRTSIATLYAANTAGAAVGVLLVSFVVLPRLGVLQTGWLLAAVNGSIFGLTRLLDAGPCRPEPETRGDRRRPALARPWAFAAVVCTGFVTFGLEVAWFRALRAAFWSTSATFAILLAAVLVPLAVGARAVPWLRRRDVAPSTPLFAAAAAILLATPFVERMDLAIGVPGADAVVWLTWFGLSLAVIGPAVVCLATLLPWCLEEYPDPATTGRLYGANALASVAGSVVAAWLLLPAFGFARTSWSLGIAVAVVALLVAAPRRRVFGGLVAACSLVLAVDLSSSPGRDRVQFDRGYSGYRILAHEEAADFTASVIEAPAGTRMLLIDGFVATADDTASTHYMEWMGRLPAILHPAPQRGLVICFGTGQTANALRKEAVEELDVVELSPSVLALAALFPVNENVLHDARVSPIVMDGRAWLRRTDRTYDVITLEPMPPNFAGVNALYSQEFYAILASRLRPGGIAAQWLPLHMLKPQHAASIARTFLEAFPDSLLWYDPVGSTGILVGRAATGGPPLGRDWPGLDRRWIVRDLRDSEIRRSVWLTGDPLERYSNTGGLVTDDNQLLQWSAMRPRSDMRFSRQLNEANRSLLEWFAGRPAFSIR